MKPFALFFAALLLVAPIHADDADWQKPLSSERQAAHVLNRLAFGPRPGELAQVQKIGVQKWISRQMAPQKIKDETLEAEVAGFKTLQMDGQKLVSTYASDQAKFIRDILEAQKRAEKGDKKKDKDGKAMPDAPTLLAALKGNQKREYDAFLASGLPYGTSIQAVGELAADKIARGIDSNRQLQEVLVDFWGNHFNLDVKKGPVRVLKVLDDRQAIRPQVFSSFRELLGASAHSAAMLYYLDNARSTKEMTMGKGDKAKKRGGLNENYAREIMELHTLGVDGGYTQTDVTEVARCFTGWGIIRDSGEFQFRAAAHDDGEKTVLGVKIPAGGGQKDGEMVLDILAKNPSTAKFIARKLCVRFVADEPPASLVDKVASAFSASKGDLKTTYRAIFESPEFWSEGAYRAKIKSPFEFAVSAVRALGGTFEAPDPQTPVGRARLMAMGAVSTREGGGNRGGGKNSRIPLAVEIARMGQPLYSYQAPTGYPEDSREWVSSSALVSRLNFGLALTSGKIGDVSLAQDTFKVAPIQTVSAQLVNGDLSPTTLATLEKESADGAKLRALVLGAPEFQRK